MSNLDLYQYKYLKYKNKYLDLLKSQSGGFNKSKYLLKSQSGGFAAATTERLCIYLHCAPTKLMSDKISELVDQTIREEKLKGVNIIIAINGFQIDPKTGKLLFNGKNRPTNMDDFQGIASNLRYSKSVAHDGVESDESTRQEELTDAYVSIFQLAQKHQDKCKIYLSSLPRAHRPFSFDWSVIKFFLNTGTGMSIDVLEAKMNKLKSEEIRRIVDDKKYDRLNDELSFDIYTRVNAIADAGTGAGGASGAVAADGAGAASGAVAADGAGGASASGAYKRGSIRDLIKFKPTVTLPDDVEDLLYSVIIPNIANIVAISDRSFLADLVSFITSHLKDIWIKQEVVYGRNKFGSISHLHLAVVPAQEAGAAETGSGAAETGHRVVEPGYGATKPGPGAAKPGPGAAKPGHGAAETGSGAAETGHRSKVPRTTSPEPDTHTFDIVGEVSINILDPTNEKMAQIIANGLEMLVKSGDLHRFLSKNRPLVFGDFYLNDCDDVILAKLFEELLLWSNSPKEWGHDLEPRINDTLKFQ